MIDPKDLPDPKVTVTRYVDNDTKTITLPHGKTIDAKDLSTVLREYLKLSPEDQTKEKQAWLNVFNQIIPPNPTGDSIIDIKILPDEEDNHHVVFAYINRREKQP